MANNKNRKAIWRQMKPASLRRLAMAVFLMFSVLGPLEILMESNLKLLPWSFVILQIIISGGIAGNIILTLNNKKLLFLSIAFWSLLFVLNARGFFVNFDESGMQVHIERNVSPTGNLKVEPVSLTSEQLSSIYTQRGIIGLIAIGLLTAGYVTFIYVIRTEVGQRARFETEVKIAQDIQKSLLPEPFFKTPWCEAAGIMIPAAEVGGDYFDVVQLPDSRIAIVVADVTGHGVGAGILSSMTKSAFRLQLQHDPSPVKVFESLNRTIFDLSNDKTFVTCAYALIDNNTKTVRLSTAGHPPVLFYQDQPNEVRQIRTASPGLGMKREGRFFEEHFQFERNDGLFLYTDGVTEANDSNGGQFGLERIEPLTRTNFGSAQSLSNVVQAELAAFAGKAAFQDDITLVCVKFL
jgi:hypothetical protein